MFAGPTESPTSRKAILSPRTLVPLHQNRENTQPIEVNPHLEPSVVGSLCRRSRVFPRPANTIRCPIPVPGHEPFSYTGDAWLPRLTFLDTDGATLYNWQDERRLLSTKI